MRTEYALMGWATHHKNARCLDVLEEVACDFQFQRANSPFSTSTSAICTALSAAPLRS